MREVIVWALALVVACGPGNRNNGPCDPGQISCDGNELLTCDGDGTFQDTMTCPNACSPGHGCTACVPNTGTCSGNDAHTCNADGTGYTDETCDPIKGETCDPMTGGCTGPCSQQALGLSYIGCEYYPTVTGNVTGDAFDYAVAISNASSAVANVQIEGGALTTPLMVTVQPGQLLVQKLPWQQQLKMCNAADTPELPGCSGAQMSQPGLVTKGAYHLRSDNPITLYQFNSLEYGISNNTDFSYSNDASLMLPINVWRASYFVAAWQPLEQYPSLLAITAAQDGTNVMISSKAATDSGSTLPAIAAGGTAMLTLNAGDAIELSSLSGDFTGTKLDSDKPIQVIGGHFCADVPTGAAACDHLEESMFGIDTLSSTYVIAAPAVTTLPNGKVETIRIIATQPGTTLTYDPPQASAPASIANAGDFVEIANNPNAFSITASSKVLVAQYMSGQTAGGNTGDPAMALAVPVEQFRTSYLFHAPTSYESNYVDIIAPVGAAVSLDGGAAITLTPIGGSAFALGRVNPLTAGPANDGNHSISGTAAFGISVYGYGQYTSYWYPGGLNLTSVID
jgi:hypothetical protein